jgi:hypothetical protein
MNLIAIISIALGNPNKLLSDGKIIDLSSANIYLRAKILYGLTILI